MDPQMTVIGIAVRPGCGLPMLNQERVRIDIDSGVEGDYKTGQSSRQVSIMSLASWQAACADLGQELPWQSRRANILVEGHTFGMADLGRVIVSGSLRLKICKETMPCHKMDAVYKGLKEMLRPEWRGGVCCRVLAPGEIALGEVLTVVDADAL